MEKATLQILCSDQFDRTLDNSDNNFSQITVVSFHHCLDHIQLDNNYRCEKECYQTDFRKHTKTNLQMVFRNLQIVVCSWNYWIHHHDDDILRYQFNIQPGASHLDGLWSPLRLLW